MSNFHRDWLNTVIRLKGVPGWIILVCDYVYLGCPFSNFPIWLYSMLCSLKLFPIFSEPTFSLYISDMLLLLLLSSLNFPRMTRRSRWRAVKVGCSCMAISESWGRINGQLQSLHKFQQSNCSVCLKMPTHVRNGPRLSPLFHSASGKELGNHLGMRLLKKYIWIYHDMHWTPGLWVIFCVFFQEDFLVPRGHIKAPKWHLKGPLATSKWHTLLVCYHHGKM